MNERRWERFGASMGIVFFVLTVASFQVAKAPPKVNASLLSINSYFAANSTRLLAGAVLATLGALAILLFAGHLRHVLQRAEGGVEAFSPIVFGSGIALAVVGMISGLPMATLAYAAQSPEAKTNPAAAQALSAGTTRALFDANYLAAGMALMTGALFLVAAGIAITLGELAQPWLGWLALLGGVLALAGGIAQFFATSATTATTAVVYIGFIAFALWPAIAGIVMLYRPEVERVKAPRAVFTH
jgi:hypothetical protein